MRHFTSTRDITALHALPNGSLRVESSGGVIQIMANRGASVLTRKECLPPRLNAVRPKSSQGAFVTAHLADGLTAVFGDVRLWQGEQPGPLLPPHLRSVTALTRWQGKLVVGVRRQGAWIREGDAWQPLTRHDDEPKDHNIQALAYFGNTLFASTLDQGLLTYDGQHWNQFLVPTLSTNAPRQLLIHGKHLLVRHGDGQVDVFNGQHWERDTLKPLVPRHEASALGVDENALYVLQWGGFSQCVAGRWTHHFDLPALRATPLTCALHSGETLFIGTQGKGLKELTRGAVTHHDERNGLPDDWITTLAKTSDGTLWAGTFVGGLARLRPGTTRWESITSTSGHQITALETQGNVLLAATRQALYRATPNPVELTPMRETQALSLTPVGLWTGGRIGLYANVARI